MSNFLGQFFYDRSTIHFFSFGGASNPDMLLSNKDVLLFETLRYFNFVIYLFIYSCVPKANCGDFLDVRAGSLLCLDDSTTCCHVSKIIEAPDEYGDEESCSSLVDEGWRYSCNKITTT